MIEQTKKLAHELRLLGLLESLGRRCAEAESGGLMPAEFLKLILEDERTFRKNRVAKALETKAKFRHQACFEDWDASYDRGISKAKLKDLSQLSFLHNREHLLLVGGTGEGKSHLGKSNSASSAPSSWIQRMRNCSNSARVSMRISQGIRKPADSGSNSKTSR